MALETLKGIEKIGEYPVMEMDSLRERFPERFREDGSMDYNWFETEIRPNHFIYIRHDVNSISFTIQNKPIKEVGVNGCQVDALIHAALLIIAGLDNKFPCEHNKNAIGHLKEALMDLQARTRDREERGVEG